MHEVRDHRMRLAVDFLLARLVEVELHELVASAADVDRAARRVVRLDRVAVVDDRKRRGVVVETDRGKVGDFRAVDIDRPLIPAEPAGLEPGAQRAPVRGPPWPE